MNDATIFANAFQKDTPAERAAYLDEACAGNAEQRRRVEVLLNSHEQAGSFLEKPAAEATLSYLPPSDSDDAQRADVADLSGGCIGPYKLLQEIGHGGMGVVYMAEQTEPVRRRVALKVIKPGMDSREVIARFEAERQALALMDHQNIARVLDAGTTDGGRPYFVMELVKGVPITRFCDQNELTPRERLELFLPVCRAVQHAHQKGILHRDLKPGNVLVSLYDGKPVPKIIDFGVAKALDQRLTERTLFTQFGQIVGTFEYMSPEQAEMSALDVDTRTDVYSLGVLLYELLTGTTPLGGRRLREASLQELLRLIREEETPRPSTRLSESAETRVVISQQRKTEPQKLARVLRGELDWIVMKALEKDRKRRYETAAAFARDVERYLSGEAVEACPPSAAYKLAKFARKHRAALLGSIAFVALLVTGTAISIWQAVRATAAETQARYDEQRARDAESQANRDRQVAERERRRAEFVRDFLLGVFQSPRKEADGRQIRVVELLDRAAGELERGFRDDPVLRADLLQALGATYDNLNLPKKALPLLEEADRLNRRHRPDALQTVRTRAELAMARGSAGDLREAYDPLLTAHRTCLEHRELGPDAPLTQRAAACLALALSELGRNREAIALLKETRERLWRDRRKADFMTLLAVTSSLVQCHERLGELETAVKYLGETTEWLRRQLAADSPLLLSWEMRYLHARIKHREIDRERAVAEMEKFAKQYAEVFGDDDRGTLHVRNSLAKLYRDSGEFSKAIALYENVIESWRRLHGDDNLFSLLNEFELGYAKLRAGDDEQGIRVMDETAQKLIDKHGLEWVQVRNCADEIAGIHFQRGHYDRAAALVATVTQYVRDNFPPDSPTTTHWISRQVLVHMRTGNYRHAENLLLEVEKIHRGALQKADRLRSQQERLKLSHTLARLAIVRLALGRFPEAEAAARECLALRRDLMPDHWVFFGTQCLIGQSLLGRRKYDEAETFLLSGYRGMKEREQAILPTGRPSIQEVLESIVQMYQVWDKPENADPWREKLRATRRQKAPDMMEPPAPKSEN